MDDCLYTINTTNLHDLPNVTEQLEQGQIIYLQNHAFSVHLNEQALLSDSILDPKHKNISYDFSRQQLSGLSTKNAQNNLSNLTQTFMHRFAMYAKELIDTVLPQYTPNIRWGRTSYRPAEIKDRSTSKRKDDTRVHVDSFAATPVNGLRILRVFCNINPYEEPRIWHTGEPFSQILNRFSSQISEYNPLQATLLKWVKATKTLRSPYDHYMLHLHDKMKLDDEYQQTLTKQRIDFPANSSWIVFTDQVSHAALSGQFLLEQTFYLPVDAMVNSDLSPLKQWEEKKNCALLK